MGLLRFGCLAFAFFLIGLAGACGAPVITPLDGEPTPTVEMTPTPTATPEPTPLPSRACFVDDDGVLLAEAPDLLSDTRCFDDVGAQKPSARMISYDVNAPLWTDGATKRRWISLPDDATIGFAQDDPWALPVGSAIVKTFASPLDGQPVETRFLIQRSAGVWETLSYVWNAEGTDATLRDEIAMGQEQTVAFGTYEHVFPSGTQCATCHSDAAAVAPLGVKTAQLNRPRSGEDENQLSKLESMGLFSQALPLDPDALPAMVLPASLPGDTPALAEMKGRSYLDANCAHCHRPDGTCASAGLDLRSEATLAETGLCGTGRITPGDAPNSRIVQVLQQGSMPQVRGNVTDAQGVAVLSNWIETMSATACVGL